MDCHPSFKFLVDTPHWTWIDMTDHESHDPEQNQQVGLNYTTCWSGGDIILSNAQSIDNLIDNEVASGIDPQRIILFGSSSGGAQALTTALRSRHDLGGVVAHIAFLPRRDEYPAALPTDGKRNLRIMFCSGQLDPVHTATDALVAQSKLVALGISVNVHLYSGRGHQPLVYFMKPVKTFLTKLFKAPLSSISAYFIKPFRGLLTNLYKAPFSTIRMSSAQSLGAFASAKGDIREFMLNLIPSPNNCSF